MKTLFRILSAAVALCATFAAQSSQAQSAYVNAVLAANPVAYWRLDEPDGTVLNDYLTVHTGVYNGGVTLQQSGYSTFDTNKAAAFNGSSGYAQVPYFEDLNSTNFSAECWVYPTGGAGNYRSPLSNRDTSTPPGPQGYMFYADFEDHWGFWMGGGPASWQGAVGPTVVLNQWTHLVGTFDGTTQVLYVNGQMVASQHAVLSSNTQAPFNIGAGANENPSPTFYWPGRVDEVAIYGAALTTDQVQAHYLLGAFGTTNASLPIIAQEPQPVKLYAGRTAAFAVQAQSALPMSYQWKSNNVAIAWANNSTFTIPNIQSTFSGTLYSVTIANQAGATNSATAALTVVAPTSAYESAILVDQPVAYWRLNETSDPSAGGVIANEYWGGFNGTYGVAAANGGSGVNGPVPPACRGFETTNHAFGALNGTPDAYVTVPALNLNANTVTFTAWIKPSGAQSGGTPLMYGNVPYGNNENKIAGFTYSAAGTLGYTWNNNDPATSGWDSGLTPPDGIWSLVALVVSPTKAEVYVINTNGMQLSTFSYANIPQKFGSASGIGDLTTDTTGSHGFNGIIDEAAVFNRSLLANEIIALYTAATGTGGLGVAPVIHSQPSSVSLWAGRRAKLTVSADGIPSPSFQWKAGATGSGQYTNLTDGGNISGSGTPTLIITNISTANAADYVAVITNNFGSVTSSVATLGVLPLPAFGAYANAVLAANPAAYWRLDETDGTALYDYVGGHDGLYVGVNNGLGSVNFGVAGYSTYDTNTAVAFDGYVGYGWVPYSANLNPPTFSVECWVYPTGGAGSYRSPFSNRSTAGGPQGYLLYANDQDKWSFWMGSGGGWIGADGPAVVLNEWTYLVGTFDGTNQVLYVNGQQVVSQPAVLSPNAVAPLNIGAGRNEASPTFYWPGTVDEVAIYATPLTATQVQGHYVAATTGALPPPTISSQPQPLTRYAGGTASFSVQADSTLPPIYQWMAGASGSGHYTNLTDVGNISGSATPTLIITSISAANAGDYVVVVTASGSVTSSVATLTVLPAGAYASAVLAANPVAYWRLGETNGTVLHDYVGGHNGDYTADVTLNQPGYSTYDTDRSASFFSPNPAYASVPYSAGLNPPKFSLECWVYPTGGAGNYRSPFSNRYINNGGNGYLMYANDQDKWSFWLGIGAGAWIAAEGPAVVLNQWTHLVGSYDGTNQVFYVNGQQVVSQAATLSVNTAAPLNIGRGANDESGNFYWRGRVDEVAVYATPLTTGQVLDHYALATTGALPSQTLHYTFSNGKLTLNWTTGTLLQAPYVLGPWSTNLATSPFDVNPTNARTYYRLITK